MTVRLSYELEGAPEFLALCEGISRRALVLGPAFETIMRLAERAELQAFAGGRLVESGRLMESLTSPSGDGAIREAHAQMATFGTSVPYARAAAAQAGTHILEDAPPNTGEVVLSYVMGNEALL
jgi:phage gpG-like protein